jgi:hypothetical protein
MRRSSASRRKKERDGRSGEIRTHDPQHPMLMRYQAALRSDRGDPTDAIDHNDALRALQLAAFQRQLGASRPSDRRAAPGPRYPNGRFYRGRRRCRRGSAVCRRADARFGSAVFALCPATTMSSRSRARVYSSCCAAIPSGWSPAATCSTMSSKRSEHRPLPARSQNVAGPRARSPRDQASCVHARYRNRQRAFAVARFTAIRLIVY